MPDPGVERGAPAVPAPGLAARLDRLYQEYDRALSDRDPVHLVRPFTRRDDREIAGFVAAGLAFGRVESVLASIRAILAVMGPRPATFVRRFDPVRDAGVFGRFVHRWTGARDLVALVWLLRQMLDQADTIEAFFARGLGPGATDVGPALEDFSRRARALDVSRVYGRARRRAGVWYFFPRPSTGSACKRLNLYLRWMVRRDAIDLGVWRGVPASALVVPLDTHVIRVGRCLGLTRYRSPGWRMAADITAALRRLDPVDPVRYDFSLCRLGMKQLCGFESPRGDSACPLRGLCRPRA